MTALESLTRTLAAVGLYSPYSDEELLAGAQRAYTAIRNETLAELTAGRRLLALERAAHHVLTETTRAVHRLPPPEDLLIGHIRRTLAEALAENDREDGAEQGP